MRHDDCALSLGDVPVALLAGGLATRLRPITSQVPKCMVEVAGRPFIDHQLELLQRHGIRRVVLCLGHLGEQVAAHVDAGAAYGLDVRCSLDGDKLLGTAGALRRALRLLGDRFWVLYGDSYLDIDYRAVFQAFVSCSAVGLMTVLRNANQWDRSNVLFQDGRILSYDKRRPVPQMEHIDFGASLLRRSAIEPLPENQSADLADLMHDLVGRGQMAGYEVHQRFYEIGSHQGLQETDRFLRAAMLSG